jgi:hypothetical protein
MVRHVVQNSLKLVLPLLALAALPAGAQTAQRFGSLEQEAAWKGELAGTRALPAGTPTVQAASSPTLALSTDAVSLVLDPFGSFGSSTAGEDAVFDDGRLRAGTVFEYMLHARGVGFLDTDALLLPPSWASVLRDGDAIVSSYAYAGLRFEVRSELVDCERPNCAWLQQDWTVTNVGEEDAPLELSAYLDGDLFFTGDFGNDFGARRGDVLYQFDEGSDPAAPSTSTSGAEVSATVTRISSVAVRPSASSTSSVRWCSPGGRRASAVTPSATSTSPRSHR